MGFKQERVHGMLSLRMMLAKEGEMDEAQRRGYLLYEARFEIAGDSVPTGVPAYKETNMRSHGGMRLRLCYRRKDSGYYYHC